MDIFTKLLFAIGVLSLFAIVLSLLGCIGLVLHWVFRVWSSSDPAERR